MKEDIIQAWKNLMEHIEYWEFELNIELNEIRPAFDLEEYEYNVAENRNLFEKEIELIDLFATKTEKNEMFSKLIEKLRKVENIAIDGVQLRYSEKNWSGRFDLEKFEPFFKIRKDTINELISYLEELLTDGAKEQTASPRKELEFKDLFKTPFNSDGKIKDLKRILKTYNYIDEKNQWTGLTADKNELATLYWLFEDKKKVLTPGKRTPQLKTFYKEFGLIVYTDKEPTGYCTLKNISIHPGLNRTYRHLERIFTDWINRE